MNNRTEHFDFHVVGVGASAGGLEAIEALFESMLENTGAGGPAPGRP